MARPKKLASVKIAEGDRGHVGIKKIGADLVAKGKPEYPTGITAEGRKIWRDIVDNLPKNLLSRVDNGILERYVLAYQRYRECQRDIETRGLLILYKKQHIRNPFIEVQYKAAMEMHRCGGELGLSPVARARLNEPAPANQGDDPLDYLLGMGEGEGSDAWQPPPPNKRN